MSGIFKILEIILINLDNQEKMFDLSLDLSKAFDCINHEILIIKLEMYGVRGTTFELLKSYLHDRQQYVELNIGKGVFKSKMLKIVIDVPQGSI